MINYSELIMNYLKEHDVSRDMFSCMCRISSTSMNNLIKGKKPGPLLSKKIFIATKGKLNLNVPYLNKRKNIGIKKVCSKTRVVSDKR